ncbi:MAG: hypothetical protein M2R45_03462 [Verrucomicrobia subdivision 3 bacterium]|nr:hypothetical protein [Limisphaerales bacterium]
MSQTKPSSLILNSPYSAPTKHWQVVEEDDASLKQAEGRREAGYMIADPKARPHQDKGIFVPLPLVNQIRRRVDSWRAEGYPSVTGITKALLAHWHDGEQRDLPFFFCQIEAIETLIWLIEAPDSEKAGIDIEGDGGDFRRLCAKLATGTGKTVVMAMLIAWQAINRATYPQDGRFSRHIFVVAPNLTVRERLAVLMPASKMNYYDEFGIAPASMQEKLRQAKVLIRNWHALQWETEEKIKKKKGVDKRGAKSDEAYTREVLGELATARNIIVINDEAHHAWRVPAESKIRGVKKEDIDEATKWLGGLDRIHRTRGILNCFDFSATPFAPSGKRTSEEALFSWIISDFGLNDAIESGLVKTPRVALRDDALPDAKTYKSRLRHIYSDSEVRDDLNRKAESHEPLPDLVTNAYALLGTDWEKIKNEWARSEMTTPPVMITVANRTETAARIKHAFDNKDIPVEPLCDPAGILHIDSQVLKQAEEMEPEAEGSEGVTSTSQTPDKTQAKRTTKKEQASLLRQQVNTVGQADKLGGHIQNVISVGMLSEGWDARTVTHIMGLRAFTSQLLCEQVIGRGLRRASYEINEETGLFDAEYVNVFGVPFSFLPHEEERTGNPPVSPPKITVQPVYEKKQFAITWPNVIRIDRVYESELYVDWEKANLLTLDVAGITEIVEIAPIVDGKPDVLQIEDIKLEELIKKTRKQTLIFKAAQSVWNDIQLDRPGSKAVLMAELVRLADQFLDSDRIEIVPKTFKKRHLAIVLSMSKVIHHFRQAIKSRDTDKTALVLDSNYPLRASGDMRPWRTGKPCKRAKKSHINYCVYDSTWEASEAFELDRNQAVTAWVKNDHLGFEVLYVYNGVVKKYRPDFLIRLQSGEILVLETKGQQTEQDNVKHEYMQEWIAAVNNDNRFGRWQFAVSRTPADIKDILATI